MGNRMMKKDTEQPVAAGNVKSRNTKKIRKLIKFLSVSLVVVIVGVIALNKFVFSKMQQSSSQEAIQTAAATKMDIKKILSSTGTIEPLNTYNVTTLVEGEVTSAGFEEGDKVQEGDVLYKVTTDDIDSKIDTAKTILSRAEENYASTKDKYDTAMNKYNEAVADYNKASGKYSDLTIKSKAIGYVKTISVEKGDNIQAGATIATIYDNTYMLLEIPFNSASVKSSLVGKSAIVQVDESEETIKGTVDKVSSIEGVLSGNQVVKTVTIKVKNPGGITADSTATASIGDLASNDYGTFKAIEDRSIVADKSGEIASLNIKEGDRVKEGETVIILASDTYDEQLNSYQNAIDSAKTNVDSAEDAVISAKEKIEDAEDDLSDIINNKSDYNITAPISGKIISKDILVGDTISKDKTSTLCTIYDLSALNFEMFIDELDIMEVKEGQTVNITADALEGVPFYGIVINISLESTTNGGVTQYPVTVQIDDTGNLLPGMNVTGEIVVNEVKDVLAVPKDALMRGDQIYVRDAGVTEANGDVPAGFKAVDVETGVANEDYIEIINGLSEDDEVYVEHKAEAVESEKQSQ